MVKHVEGAFDRLPFVKPEGDQTAPRRLIVRIARARYGQAKEHAVRVVAIETSGTVGSVALVEAGAESSRILSERRLPAGQRTARSLLPCLNNMLKEQGWQPKDVELVATTSGPGSFTGLRIGVVTAKTFAYARGAQLVGVHTLAAMAAGVGEYAGRLWTVLDAQRGELFMATFDRARALADAHPPETKILAVPKWLEQLSAGDIVAGPPLAKWREQLPDGVMTAHEESWTPMAGAVGRLAALLFHRHGGVSPMKLVPQYYRRSAAEEKSGR
jgi:tRNA threonylcarbamoyladenosine biosynthesis protein TsaB